MSKRKLLAQLGSLACKGKILGKGRDGKQCECLNAASLGRSEDLQTSGFWFHDDALLLLLLNLPLYQLHG